MENKPVYLDPSYSFEERAKDLVSRMTIEEKVSQMLYNSPAIERLGIPAYNWWNEALHGVARAGTATMFPQAIGMAATFDEELIYKVADVISTEGRAKYHASSKKGDRGIYKGLTFWSPNINIFRDPRWGRGQETYGEDPYLTARLGVAFVKGLQGNHPKYLKAGGMCKNILPFTVVPESLRHEFNAVVSKKDLYETYLPAFKALVQEAKVESVMGAYNRTNGEPCCGSKTLLSDILRGEWGFKGHVVSDCWAIRDFHMHHHVTATAPESAALAVRNGCDLNCGNMFGNLLIALKEGLITEEEIDRAVTRLMITRMKLGMFDPEDQVPYASISSFVDCKEHRELALDVAKKSIVLLKNDGLLPLDRKKIRSIAVIGPNADSRQALIGNYEGTASEYVTVLDGIREMAGDDVRIYYSVGCHLYKDRVENLGEPGDRIAEAVTCAEHADVVIMCLGLDSTIEGEEMHESNIYGSGDKPDLNLPGQQQELLEAVYATGKPIVLVLLTGSALAVTWADEHIPAILNAWYPGALGGRAIASVLFGETNPSGKLPVTFYRTTEELPDFTDYSMENRTYRFMKNEALYPFGFGLSYTTFDYSDLKLSKDTIRAGEGFNVSVKVTNTGKMAGEEVVQVYIKDLEASWRVPNWQLSGMKRVRLESGETAEITFEIRPEQLAVVTDEGKSVIEPGEFEIYVGGSQPDARSVRLMGKAPLKAVLRVQ
uniref:Beta-xylosidase B n=1 Tax=Thermoclostridium stercorarium TaxID=1510 RepID=Q8GJ42_THEST|nr:beta-xylosidase B [Thermoclostridium stercorarium]